MYQKKKILFHLNMKVGWPWFDEAYNAFINKPLQK